MSAPQSAAMSGRLALSFQEAFTAAGRLKDRRQVPSDPDAFRAHIRQLLGSADETARRMGYPDEFSRASVYAVVALIDEAMLGTPGALASAWAGRPLQDEVFGSNVAGEAFFQQLDDLLARQDSPYVADVLEVHLLCMQLGFRGRFAAADGSGLRGYMDRSNDKIRRTRGRMGLSPRALPPRDESVSVQEDPVQRWLVIAPAGGAGSLALAILLLRLLSVGPGVAEIRDLVAAIGLS